MIDKPHAPSCERNREPILAVLREHFADRRGVLEIGSGTGQHAVFFAEAMPWLTWQCSDRAEYLPGIQQWLDEAGLANTPAAVALDVARGPWPALLTLPLAGSDDLLANHRFADRLTPERRSGRGLLGKAKPHLAEGWGEGTRDPAGADSHEIRSPGRHRVGAHPHPPAREGQHRFDVVFSANTLHIMGWPEVEALFASLATVLTDDAILAVYGPFNYGGEFSSDSNREFDGWLKARDPRSGIRDLEAVDALAQTAGLRRVDDVAMPAHNRCVVWQRSDAT